MATGRMRGVRQVPQFTESSPVWILFAESQAGAQATGGHREDAMVVRSASRRRAQALALAAALALALLVTLPGSARAAGANVAISQVYGGGGNTGAPLANDFVELLNRGTTSASVAGTTTLGCNGSSTPCPSTALERIVDLVGYDGANFFEGTGPAPAGSNTAAVLRRAGGCTDTDDNAADFSAGAPGPRNTATAPNPCPANQPVVASCGGPLSTIVGTAATAKVTASDADGRVTSIAIDSVTPSPAPGSIALGDLVPAPATGGQASANVTVDASTPVGSYAVTVSASNDDP